MIKIRIKIKIKMGNFGGEGIGIRGGVRRGRFVFGGV